MKHTFKYLLLLSLLLNLFSCGEKSSVTDVSSLLIHTIDSHGTENFYGKKVSFDFRDHSYTLYRDSTLYEYTRRKDTIEDRLHSKNGYSRHVNDRVVNVIDSMATNYSNSVNSVLYFFQLPLVLNDAAVQKEYKGTTTIKAQEYHTMKVTFRQEGGGVDFEDEFRYWINTESFEIDYLAYSYLTDGGGVRFREAFGKKRIDNILFQDYRNYKPSDKRTPLDSLPGMFEKGELELLSVIENENIQVNSIE